MNTTAENYSTPRRMPEVDDYIEILRRQRAWILGPTFFGLVAGTVTAFLWPDTYTTGGIIRIVPSQVSKSLMSRASVTEDLIQRLNTIYQSIIQRNSLINLIQTYNLYPDDRKRYPMEDVVETMRKDIRMGSVESITSVVRGQNREGIAFALRFSYVDRRKVQQVCQDLVGSFINESIRLSSSQSTQTTEFFRDELERARQDLESIDKRITEFRMKNMGVSAQDEQALNARVNTLESTAMNLNNGISRSQQDKLQLESQLRFSSDQLAQLSTPVVIEQGQQSVQAVNQQLVSMDRQIDQMEASLATLKEAYKESHPDVVRMQGLLNLRKQERERLAASASEPKQDQHPPKKVVVNRSDSAEARALASEVAKLRSALQAKDMEIEDLVRQLKETRDRIRAYLNQIGSSPLAQQQYQQLLRDREQIAKDYQELSGKMSVSELASNLQSRKQGETLEVLDPPVVPTDPAQPKRGIIIGLGLALGAALGIAFSGIREIKDSSLKNLKDVRAYTHLTVLASVPLLENDFVVRRRRRIGWLAWSAALLLGVLVMSGSVAYYFTQRT